MAIDIWRNFKFEVEVDGFVRAGFSKVTGLKQTTEIIEYREGGENETPRKLPGQTKFDNITLERGKTIDTDFTDWAGQVFTIDARDGAQGDDNFRKRVVIYLKDKSGARVRKWTLVQTWPTEYSAGDLDASSNEVLVNSLVLAHEGMKEEAL